MRYLTLSSILLNELQTQAVEVRKQTRKNQRQAEQIQELAERGDRQAEQNRRLSADEYGGEDGLGYRTIARTNLPGQSAP